MEEELPILPAKNITEWLVLDLKNNFGLEVYSSWTDLEVFQMGSRALPKEFMLLQYQTFNLDKSESGCVLNYNKYFLLYIKYNKDLEELSDQMVEWLSNIEYFVTQRGQHNIDVEGGDPIQDVDGNHIMVIKLRINQL